MLSDIKFEFSTYKNPYFDVKNIKFGQYLTDLENRPVGKIMKRSNRIYDQRASKKIFIFSF